MDAFQLIENSNEPCSQLSLFKKLFVTETLIPFCLRSGIFSTAGKALTLLCNFIRCLLLTNNTDSVAHIEELQSEHIILKIKVKK